MSLKDWITGKNEVATAIPAIAATEEQKDSKFVGTATAIVAIPATANLPEWCNSSCGNFEEIDLPKNGITPGCVIQGQDIETWRRLDRMTACPVWN